MLTFEATLALRTFVYNFLQDNTAKSISQSDFHDTVKAINRTVQETISQFAADWNSHTRRPIDLLPTEILAKCFGWLDLLDRASVSLVSHEWQAMSLNDPTLWATAVIRSPLQSAFIPAQSQTVMLRLYIAAVDANYINLKPHLQRLVSLHVHTNSFNFELFAARPNVSDMVMPNLRGLRWILSSQVYQLFCNGAELAPKLETLAIDYRDLTDEPQGMPFKNVTTLETAFIEPGILRETILAPYVLETKWTQNFWEMFPNIQRLAIRLLNAELLVDAGEPPASLHTVSLCILHRHDDFLGNSRPSTKYNTILDGWTSTRIQAATFMWPSGEHHLLIQYFIRSHNRPWTLRWGAFNWNIRPLFSNTAPSDSVEFWVPPAEDVSHAPLFVVTLEHRLYFSPQAIHGIHQQWRLLTALELQDALLVGFIRANIQLPEVTCLTLIATGRANRWYRQDLHRFREEFIAQKASGMNAKMPSLRLPLLRDVEFRCMVWPSLTSWPSWDLDRVRIFLCRLFPATIEHHVRKAEPTLKRVTLRLIHHVFDAAVEERWDLNPRLKGLAAEIHVEREVVGLEPEVADIPNEDRLFVPSLYM